MELRERLLAAGAGGIRKIIVYGSRARGDAEPDSDMDVAVIVERNTRQLEKALDDVAYQVMWDHDFRPIISLFVFDEGHFDNAVREGFSFYRNVLREGVVM
jgi:predicted nucleotidyltransferase